MMLLVAAEFAMLFIFTDLRLKHFVFVVVGKLRWRTTRALVIDLIFKVRNGFKRVD
jgi:hypothetical protein